MKTKLIALAMLLCQAGPAAAAGEAEFGLSLAAFKEAPAGIGIPVPPASHNGNKYFSRGCTRLELGPGDGPVQSAQAELFSQEFIEECAPLPPGGLGLLIEHCYSRPLRSWSRAVRLLADPRPLPPGKKEIFEVCLEGGQAEVRPISALYTYTQTAVGTESTLFILTPRLYAPFPAKAAAGK